MSADEMADHRRRGWRVSDVTVAVMTSCVPAKAGSTVASMTIVATAPTARVPN
jgi:hypothetical protein